MRVWAFGVVVLTSCGAASTPESAVAAAGSEEMAASVSSGPACPASPALHRFEVPQFALPHGAYADEVDGRIVVMHVGPTHEGGRVPVGQLAEFHGAMYDLTSRAWTDLPAPPQTVLPRGPSAEALFVTVGSRVAMLVYSSAAPRIAGFGTSTATAVFDPASMQWAEVPQADAPPRAAYLTRPFRAESTDRFWVWFPAHDNGTNYAGGYALDVVEGRWVRTNPTGAPSARSFSRPALLPGGRLLVIPVKSSEAGIFDPSANRWDSFVVPVSESGYEATSVSSDGRTASVLHFEEAENRTRRIAGYLLDLSSKRVGRLPEPDVRIGFYPNPQMLHVDGRHVVYVNEETMHVFDRESRGWSRSPLPFENPVTNSGSLFRLCGGRFITEHEPWILHTDDLTWHALQWPEDVPMRGRHIVHRPDHRLILGDVRRETEETNCPPGAPCMAPETRTIEVRASFSVPLSSGAVWSP